MKKNALDHPYIRINLLVGCIGIVMLLLSHALLISALYLSDIASTSTHSDIAGYIVLFTLAILSVVVQCNGLLMAMLFIFNKPFRIRIYQFLCRGNLRLALLLPARKFYQMSVCE